MRPNQAGGGRHVCNCGYMTDAAATGFKHRGLRRDFEFVLQLSLRLDVTFNAATISQRAITSAR